MDKVFQRTLISSMLLGSSLFISGCGGSGSDDAGSQTQTLAGIVSDPAIKDASVTLFNASGEALSTATTDALGKFAFNIDSNVEVSELYIRSTNGIDTLTGESFKDVHFYSPVAAFSQQDKLMVTPLTSLLGKSLETDELETLKNKLGVDSVLVDPTSHPDIQKLAFKLTLLLKSGVSADDVAANLDDVAGLTGTDLDIVLQDKADLKEILEVAYDELESAGDDQITKFIRDNLRRAILKFAGIQQSVSNPLSQQVAANVNALIDRFIALAKENDRVTMLPEEVLASIAHGGQLSLAVLESDSFDVTQYPYIELDTDTTADDDISLMYYTVPNSETNNDQLIVHDTKTNKQKVLKTNAIINGRAFIFNGEREGEKTVYHSRAYGLMLDPDSHQETRIGINAWGRPFEYQFSFDNSLLAYNVNKPSEERLIFSSDNIPDDIKQQVKAIGTFYQVVDNLYDKENSYVHLKAYESLSDPQRNEVSTDKVHLSLTVRLSDGAVVIGRPVTFTRNQDSKTSKVLISHEVPHIDGQYPTDSASARHLKMCDADLTNCRKIADGDFYFTARSNGFLYFTKQDSDKFYALNIETEALNEVTGATYPASFDADHHLIGAFGHGQGVVLSNWSTLSGITTQLQQGDNAFAAINYDLDIDSPFHKIYIGTPWERGLNMPKNGQVVKFNGLKATKLFDTGDGVDQGNLSEGEAIGGHINLIAAENGKVFIEVAGYDGTPVGGDCTPNARGFYCFNVEYGYVFDDAENRNKFDGKLAEKKNLKYFYVRRLPPFSLNGVLYVNTIAIPGDAPGNDKGHIYDLRGFDTNTLEKVSETRGRSYFSMTARYDDGRLEGQVIAWNGETGELKNITTNTVIAPDIAAVVDEPYVQSVLAAGTGLPIAGLGTAFGLRVNPGDHNWYIVAGDADSEGSTQSIDQLPFSTWLYY